MADALYDGRLFRALAVIDEGNREALGIEIGTSIPSARIIGVLDDLMCAETASRRFPLRYLLGVVIYFPFAPRGSTESGTQSCVALVRTSRGSPD